MDTHDFLLCHRVFRAFIVFLGGTDTGSPLIGKIVVKFDKIGK
jgi:hypothetical protein